MNRPSSTITAAAIAGAVATVLWELVSMFTMLEPTPALIAGTTTIFAAVAGYLKRENVLPVKR